MKVTYPVNGVFQSFWANRQHFESELKETEKIDTKIEDKKLHKKVAAAAIIGAIAPVIAINLSKGRGSVLLKTLKNNSASFKDKFNSVRDIFETESFAEMLASTAGSIGLATACGIKEDKNPENKNSKIKEGVFEFLNNMTPTCLVAAGKIYADKTGKFAHGASKTLRIISSVVLGMFIANKTSNKLNKDFFDKNEPVKEKRNFKLTDCLVHMDDIIGIFVVDKNPIAKAIQLDKLLPLLYARAAYDAGVAKKNKTENNNCDNI